jgi:hypothetical protein
LTRNSAAADTTLASPGRYPIAERIREGSNRQGLGDRDPGGYAWSTTFGRGCGYPLGEQRRFYRVSEQTDLRSSIEVEHQDLAKREADLAEEILTRLAWHFGLEAFSH